MVTWSVPEHAHIDLFQAGEKSAQGRIFFLPLLFILFFFLFLSVVVALILFSSFSPPPLTLLCIDDNFTRAFVFSSVVWENFPLLCPCFPSAFLEMTMISNVNLNVNGCTVIYSRLSNLLQLIKWIIVDLLSCNGLEIDMSKLIRFSIMNLNGLKSSAIQTTQICNN